MTTNITSHEFVVSSTYLGMLRRRCLHRMNGEKLKQDPPPHMTKRRITPYEREAIRQHKIEEGLNNV